MSVNHSRTKLDCIPMLRLEMGRIYRKAKAGLIEPELATRLVNILREMRCCLEAEAIGELGVRMAALEDKGAGHIMARPGQHETYSRTH